MLSRRRFPKCTNVVSILLIMVLLLMIFMARHDWEVSPRSDLLDLRVEIQTDKTLRQYNHWSKLFEKPPDLDCSAYIEGDPESTNAALKRQKEFKRSVIPDAQFVEITRDCDEYKRYRGYPTAAHSNEGNFSIAFSILLYKEAEQAERLLRAIYHVNNIYCIHVDGFSPPVLHLAMQSIASCFTNVFIVTKTEKVVYEGMSRLQADLNCMSDLTAKHKSWQYFINLPSQTFPLKTNSELIKILKIYNGANDIEGLSNARSLPKRYKFSHALEKLPKSDRFKVVKTNKTKKSPPHKITVVKGSAYGVFSKKFVEYIVTDQKSRDLLTWMKDVNSPDEYFWATLNHLHLNAHLKTPGGYKDDPTKKPWLATYAAWGGADPCNGRWMRGVCVFGLGDLPMLTSRKELFANKFELNFHPFSLYCLEEWLEAKRTTKVPLDLLYYRKLPFVFH